jgi:hypothetical protein
VSFEGGVTVSDQPVGGLDDEGVIAGDADASAAASEGADIPELIVDAAETLHEVAAPLTVAAAAGAAGYLGATALGADKLGERLGDSIYDYEHPTPVDPSLDAIDSITVSGSEEGLDAIDTITYQNPHTSDGDE